jgi:hypothetical protein
MKKFALLSLLLITFDAHAAVNVLGRLGVGFTNQMANEVESISFKSNALALLHWELFLASSLVMVKQVMV